MQKSIYYFIDTVVECGNEKRAFFLYILQPYDGGVFLNENDNDSAEFLLFIMERMTSG